MNRYVFDITCPGCGGYLVHQADGTATPMLTQAVAACPKCACEYVIRVALTPVGRTRPDRHIQPNTLVTSLMDAGLNGRRRTYLR